MPAGDGDATIRTKDAEIRLDESMKGVGEVKIADAREKIVYRESKYRVDKQFFSHGALVSEIPGEDTTIDVHSFITSPAYVTVDYSRKFNMTDYESIGIRISVSVPTYKEQLQEAKEFAANFVTENITAESEEIVELRDELIKKRKERGA